MKKMSFKIRGHKLAGVLIIIAIILVFRLPALEYIGHARSWAMPEAYLRDVLILGGFSAFGLALSLLSSHGQCRFRIKKTALFCGLVLFLYSAAFVFAMYLYYGNHSDGYIIHKFDFLGLFMPSPSSAAAKSPFTSYAQPIVYTLSGFLLAQGLYGHSPSPNPEVHGDEQAHRDTTP